jgi:cytochrome c-type biogenesis protein CcmF
MNAALGSAGVILGFVASLGGIATLGVGLARRRSRLLVAGRTYVWMVAIGAIVAFLAMERALLTHDFSIAFVANNTRRSRSTSRRCGRRSRARSSCGPPFWRATWWSPR